MHKYINFAALGGYPLTQDDMDFLQSSYTDAVTALLAPYNVAGSAIAINGMSVTDSGNTVSTGWFIYNNELLPFIGSTVTPGVGEVALIAISTTATSLTFDDGSEPDVVFNKTGILTVGASTTDATHFPVSSLVSFGKAFGINSRETGYTTLDIGSATGTITGTLKYKKDYLSNTLHYQLSCIVANPSALTSVPLGSQILLGELDANYRPNTFSHSNIFPVSNTLTGATFLLLDNSQYINGVRFSISASGAITIWLAKPHASVTAFSFGGNGIATLD